MTNNRYYHDELAYLRELGREFAQANPDAAPYLGEAGSDPDVERLLEGFAFLTGRIREKLDDEIPEFTHGMAEMLWPHYLRPIPALSVVQFEALPQAAKETHRVPRGTQLQSQVVDGTACKFETTYDVELQPLQIERVDLRLDVPPQLVLRVRVREGATLGNAKIHAMRLFFGGEPAVARGLVLCLRRLLRSVSIRAVEGGSSGRVTLPPSVVQPVGFQKHESLWPWSHASFEGFRFLQEYFAFPSKFQFLDVTQLGALAPLGDARCLEVAFELARLPERMPPLGTAGVLLHCTPVVNLFTEDADPISIDPSRSEYLVRPSSNNPAHCEVHTVTKVVGTLAGSAGARPYEPFFRFRHSLDPSGKDQLYYRAQVRPSIAHKGVTSTDTWISVTAPRSEQDEPGQETLSIEVLCTNRNLPSQLKVGDINVSTSNSPVLARFKNVTHVVPPVPPPLGTDLYWRLIAHQSLQYQSLTRLEALRAVLGLYNFRMLIDKQAQQAHQLLLEGIRGIRTRPVTQYEQGLPVRGLAIELDLDGEKFAGEGDLYLFANVLDRFFSFYVTLNSFSQLTVRNTQSNEVWEFAPRFEHRECA